MKHAQRRVTGGDRELIHEVYPSLCRFAGVVAPSDAEPEDLVQEALYRVLRRGPLSDLEYPTAYLRKVILNLVSNHQRQAGRVRNALARMNPGVGTQDEYPSDVSVLMRLSPQARAVVFLREVEGRSYAEVAEAVGCRESTARATAARARRTLRTLLSEEVRDATA